ncbi:TlpA family protein disulfide reductase [Paenibacillus faecis]|uniref:TlpA family protein disulfide reductase n=1 Tax=Paenibacillus faecis TaxID=862114 RepID=UPI001478B8CD|nr:TlpA disulfide reductase family protein [Paenibacillus faecis]
MRKNGWIWAGLLLLLLTYAVYDNQGNGWLSFLGNGKSQEAKEAGAAGKNQAIDAMVAANVPKPGTKAPEFALVGLDGKTYQVGGKRDKPLLLNFWASWCDPCKEEAPDLVKLAEKYSDTLDVFAVNVTFYDKLDDAKAFVKDYGYTFPVLLDEKEKVYRKYNGVAFPTNVLIDPDGKIRDVVVGTLPPEELEAKIRKLVEK